MEVALISSAHQSHYLRTVRAIFQRCNICQYRALPLEMQVALNLFFFCIFNGGPSGPPSEEGWARWGPSLLTGGPTGPPIEIASCSATSRCSWMGLPQWGRQFLGPVFGPQLFEFRHLWPRMSNFPAMHSFPVESTTP